MIQQQIVINPGFETQASQDGTSPAGWHQDPNYVVMNNSQGAPYAGQWCARMGGWGVDATTDYLYQDIEVPEFAIASLYFRMSMINDANAPDDPLAPSCTLTLAVRNTSDAELRVVSTWDASHQKLNGGWYQEGVFDLSEFSGQIIRLYFSSTQTTGAKNMWFFLDEVRINVLLRLPVSTFPPLISDKSRDLVDQIQMYGSRVYCSYLIHAEPNDQFFNPTYGDFGKLTGYGSNGSYFTNGIEDEQNKASWWTEGIGGGDAVTRSGTQGFPATALVLVTDQSIAILDQTDNLSLWMIFKKKRDNAYSDTFNLDANAKFVPAAVSYESGIVQVTFAPAEGSSVASIAVLCIDFAQDFIYVDVALP